MNPLYRLLLGLLLALCAFQPARAFTHPGMPLTVADLDAVKANLSVEPWKSGYAALTASGQSQLTYVMRGPFATVSRTGIIGGGDDPGAVEYQNDMQAVYNLARMWYFTGNTAYAQKARDILLAWAATHTGWGGAEPYLTMSDQAYRLFGGASILRGTWPGWTQADTDACKSYFITVYWNQGLAAVPNPLRSANQGALQLSAALGVAVFCDDEEKFAQCLQAYRADINGGLANSLPNGQVGDSGRDQGHAGGQVWSLTWMAEVFWKQGVDVYSELDHRLLAIGEFYSRYNHGAATPYIPFGTKYDYYHGGHGGLPKSSERAPDLLNILHSAYVVRKGLDAPWTSLYRATRAENADSFDFRKVADSSAAARPAALAAAAPATPALSGDLTSAGIGAATPAGSATYANGTWTVTGGGTDIWGATDGYHFVHKQLFGDFTLIANLTAFSAPSANAKVGLVVADSLAANAPRRIYVGYSPGSTVPLVQTHLRGFTANSHNDPDESTHDAPAPLLPQWLKIQRTGTRVSYFHCNDGINWVPLQHAEYAGWTGPAYVGLAVCSNLNGTPATATFTDVAITGGSGLATATVPVAPLAVYASPGNRQVPLRWLPVRGATSYTVKRATVSGGPYAAIATVADGETGYLDSGLSNGTTYHYVVSAANSAGAGADSAQDSVTPLPPVIRVEAEAYATQAGIQLENCAEGGQNVCFIGNNDWTQYTAIDFGAGATTFRARVANPSTANASIEVRLDSSTGPLVGTIPVPVTGGWQAWTTSSIPLTGVTGVRNVHLKFITGGFNLNWLEYQRLDGPAPIAPPATPAGFTATASLVNHPVALSWSASTGAASYRVKRATISGGPYVVIAENHLGTSLTDTTVAPLTTYYYVVSALNTGGESANSSQSVATTPGLLPSPWVSQDIGAVGLAGGGAYNTGIFTVQGSGGDIQSTADAFQFVYQPLTGDGAITARIATLGSGDQWAKSGVMLRDTLAADSINVCMVVSRSNGVSWQRRIATAGTTSVSTTAGIAAPQWVRLQRVGSTFSAYTSADGGTWMLRGTQSVTMGSTVYVGLAVCARNNTQLNTSTFDNVSVSAPIPMPPLTPAGLAAAVVSTTQLNLGWNAANGATSYTVKRAIASGGSYATVASGLAGTTYTDTGLAASTAYYYVVSAVNANGESANSAEASATTQTPPPATPSGLSVTAGNAQASLAWNAVSGATSYTVKRSTTSGGPYTTVATGVMVANYTDTGLTNGTTYYYVVSAVNAGGEGANSAQMSVTPVAPGLPSPWVTLDIGAVGATGSATHSAGTFTVVGSGVDIWSSSDEFRYVHQPATGDCTVTVRVASIQNTDTQAKAGIMIRETTAANFRYAGVFITPGVGVRFQRRTSTGGTTANNAVGGITAPRWLRLTRVGNVFSAYYSANGTTWTQISNGKSLTIASSATIGLAVGSRVDGTLCTAVFDNVTVTP